MARAERPTLGYEYQEDSGHRVRRAKSNGIADHLTTIDWRRRIEGAGGIHSWFERARRPRQGEFIRFEPVPSRLLVRYNHYQQPTLGERARGEVKLRLPLPHNS